MARRICIEIPLAPPPIGMTVPGMGDISTIRNISLSGYNVCGDASAFLQGLQPIMAGLGMPLCILGCLTSVIEVFSTDFPYVNPAAVTKIPAKCMCLSSFTPFGFCGLMQGTLSGMLAIIGCMLALIGDIIRMEAQAAAMLQNPETAFMGQCLQGQTQALLKNALSSMGPVTQLLNSTKFLFNFMGIQFEGVEDITGSSAAEVVEKLRAIEQVVTAIVLSVNALCPKR